MQLPAHSLQPNSQVNYCSEDNAHLYIHLVILITSIVYTACQMSIYYNNYVIALAYITLTQNNYADIFHAC